MNMGTRNFNNSIAFIGLCLYAHLVSAKPSISCNRDDFHEAIGCTRAMPLDLKCVDEEFGCFCTYDCSKLKKLLSRDREAGHVTCVVDGKWYPGGWTYEIPTSKGNVRCVCTETFPDSGYCPNTSTSFVKTVLSRVEHIQGRAETK